MLHQVCGKGAMGDRRQQCAVCSARLVVIVSAQRKRRQRRLMFLPFVTCCLV